MNPFNFKNYINNRYSNFHQVFEMAPSSPDSYGKSIGINDKSDTASVGSLEQPLIGPICDMVNSAWANLNVPTRGIPGTNGGSLGCAAAVSIIFYRATGYPIIPGQKIVLGTSSLWDHMTTSSDWEWIRDWKNNYRPGDIILTCRGSKAGHVGVVVDNEVVISNSSGGFKGDRKGQIETNYTIKSWQSVANRNPYKTACFRYKGKWRKVWGGPPVELKPDTPSLEMKHIFGGNEFTIGSARVSDLLSGTWKGTGGWELFAKVGTPVCSIFNGLIQDVSLLGSSNGDDVFGWAVTVDSEKGPVSFYANLVKLPDGIKTGKRVKIGDVIGYIGSPSGESNWQGRLYASIGSESIGTKSSDKNITSYIDSKGNILGSGESPISSIIPVDLTVESPIDPITVPKIKLLNPEDFSRNKLVLRYGSRGEQVERLQNSLIQAGYDLPQFGVDSKFGIETLEKVKKFQRDRGLRVDGEVGEDTSLALTNRETRQIERAADNWSSQTRFKIYDSQKKKVLIAKIESEKVIEIKTRFGKRLGEARIVDGSIFINYTLDGVNVSLTSADSSNSVYRGIYNIFNRNMRTTIPGEQPVAPITQDEIEQIEQTVETDATIKHNYSDPKVSANIQILLNEMNKQGITNPYTKIGILATIGKESGFIPKNEIMSYSKERLPEVWGVFSKTGKRVSKGQGKYNYNDLAVKYERQPEKLANFVYGQKPYGMKDNAFGNTSPGDGWKYRGRGFNGITFKAGYQKYSNITGIDLVSDPDRLNDVSVASEVAVKFLVNGIKSLGKDPNSFQNQTDATYYAVRANAGREVRGDETYANAQRVEKNFSIA